MKMAHSMQGIYSPLPQSISDSDSEKEISMEPLCVSYESKNKLEGVYRQNGHSMHVDDDIVKIKRGASKMSTARKVAFVSSIILCFLPIIIFLWVLPCTELHTCPVKISNWEYQQEDIELMGPIMLVNGVYKSNYNLAMMYKGSYNSPKALKNGVISFMGLTGAVAWVLQQEVEPYEINCSIIDCNNDGTLECLVVDQKGLKAIETLSGQSLWHAHSSEEKTLIGNLNMPVAFPDMNKDGVFELLSIYKKTSFIMISGQSGLALANIPVPHCGQITDLLRVEETSQLLSYQCSNTSGSVETYQVSVDEIVKSYSNPQYIIKVTLSPGEVNNNKYIAGNRRLIVNNGAACPKCQSVLTLYDDKDQVVKLWSFNNAFIMNPKSFTFQPTQAKKVQLKGHLSGFIVKIWQWSEHYQKLRPTQRVNKRSIRHPNETFFSTEVSERVVLITFNETDVHVINASFTEINQICRTDETNCQPSMDNQKDSLLVADVEHDSSTELVSFYSTYTKKDEDWHLVSFVKVLRLEEELPKLYGAK